VPASRRQSSPVDARIAELLALGATVAVTADHGMNDKTAANAEPGIEHIFEIYAAPRTNC
jgi:phosphonoacetate hydrolase